MSSGPALLPKPKHSVATIIFFILSVVLALACFAIPMYVIRPFRSQGPRELNFALHVIEWSYWLAPFAALLALLLALDLWRRGPGKLRKTGIIFGVALAALGVTATRVNIFEQMFHPDSNPHFLAPSQAWVQDDDMVLAVRIRGHARAYPIRQMGYHHIVNDVVSGEPIVATY